MSWATRRRLLILSIVGAICVAFFSVVFVTVFYKTPSCTDSMRNQDESGIDCGGSCAYLCTEEVRPLVVLFTKAVSSGDDRTDVVALIENKNATAAARNVPYSITLYGERQSLIQRIEGVLDVPPRSTMPLYIPGILSGKQKVANVFLDIDPASSRWFSMIDDRRIMPIVSNTVLNDESEMPRIESVLLNSSTAVLSNTKTIVLVHGQNGNVIAASQTVVPVIPAQGQATAVFTWNSAFPEKPTSIEVVPIIPLPSFP